MAAPRAADSAEVEAFVIEAIARGQANLATSVQRHFGVSRPTAHNYLTSLTDRGVIVRTGRGRYALGVDEHFIREQVVGLAEHDVWNDKIQPLLAGLSSNAIGIWQYGCTEMINNVIDHSESAQMTVRVKRTPISTQIEVHDFGVGIFRKIARALALEDDRHAVLELSKGKVTTDPVNHTGEGIFFSSRAFDEFAIMSGDVYFERFDKDGQDWILGEEKPSPSASGTSVYMSLSNATTKQLRNVFDAHATDPEESRFDKTIVPVKLLQYGDDHLVSRSQAKRLLTRFDRFKTVLLNFEHVDTIGQAFADEVFRVFRAHHPTVEIVPINANEQVTRMISRAVSAREPQHDLFTVNDASTTDASGPNGAGPDSQSDK